MKTNIIINSLWLVSCVGLGAGAMTGLNACTKEQTIATVTAVDAVAKDVCGAGDPLLTCLDKIERSDRVVTARRARLMGTGDGGTP